jgi:hypothetical protein
MGKPALRLALIASSLLIGLSAAPLAWAGGHYGYLPQTASAQTETTQSAQSSEDSWAYESGQWVLIDHRASDRYLSDYDSVDRDGGRVEPLPVSFFADAGGVGPFPVDYGYDGGGGYVFASGGASAGASVSARVSASVSVSGGFRGHGGGYPHGGGHGCGCK